MLRTYEEHRNRPIETIDGYDETVHRGPFQKSHSRLIAIDDSDELGWNAL